MSNANANREYKDRLFNYIFGREENKKWTLSLYNAVNNSNYTDASQIEINTIKEMLYLGMHNDTSFLISDDMNLYEQQSTYNPNMPLRQMQYAGNLYEKYILKHRLNKYGKKQLDLPIPKLVVFYNGMDEKQNETMLYLSDSFPEGKRADADIQVRVRMLNINYGKNTTILEACKPLMEYAWFVEEIRKSGEHGLTNAIDSAISQMPDDYDIKAFLEEHRTEVKGMMLTEYDEATTMELFREEGRQEGREEGKKEAKEALTLEAIQSLMKTLKLTAAEAMDALQLSDSEKDTYAKKL